MPGSRLWLRRSGLLSLTLSRTFESPRVERGVAGIEHLRRLHLIVGHGIAKLLGRDVLARVVMPVGVQVREGRRRCRVFFFRAMIDSQSEEILSADDAESRSEKRRSSGGNSKRDAG